MAGWIPARSTRRAAPAPGWEARPAPVPFPAPARPTPRQYDTRPSAAPNAHREAAARADFTGLEAGADSSRDIRLGTDPRAHRDRTRRAVIVITDPARQREVRPLGDRRRIHRQRHRHAFVGQSGLATVVGGLREQLIDLAIECRHLAVERADLTVDRPELRIDPRDLGVERVDRRRVGGDTRV